MIWLSITLYQYSQWLLYEISHLSLSVHVITGMLDLCLSQILKKRNVDISGAGMSEDGLSPLEETLASYMQVYTFVHYEIFELIL